MFFSWTFAAVQGCGRLLETPGRVMYGMSSCTGEFKPNLALLFPRLNALPLHPYFCLLPRAGSVVSQHVFRLNVGGLAISRGGKKVSSLSSTGCLPRGKRCGGIPPSWKPSSTHVWQDPSMRHVKLGACFSGWRNLGQIRRGRQGPANREERSHLRSSEISKSWPCLSRRCLLLSLLLLGVLLLSLVSLLFSEAVPTRHVYT